MSDNSEWFAPKRFGIGAGIPISWQGWALLIGYIVLLSLSGFLIRFSWVGFTSVVVILTVLLAVIAARTTKGGWRWRWGEEE
jgi:hypothetical protein